MDTDLEFARLSNGLEISSQDNVRILSKMNAMQLLDITYSMVITHHENIPRKYKIMERSRIIM